MCLLDAVEKVLKEAGRPLSAPDIAKLVLKKGLWKTFGLTPSATVSARLYDDIKKGNSRFVKAGKGVFGLSGTTYKLDEKGGKPKTSAHSNDSGYVYILTNPSFRKDWVKIGMTERPVDTRSKELDNTAVPLPFQIYATLHTRHRRRIEKLLHGMIDDFDSSARIRKSREFFNVNPELALRLLTRAAEAFDEEANVRKVFKGLIKKSHDALRAAIESPKKAQSRVEETPAKETTPEKWVGKTQLARLLARRAGNEGAYGGLLQLLTRKRACREGSKWRKPLENAGLAFDRDGFVLDWTAAKNPL